MLQSQGEGEKGMEGEGESCGKPPAPLKMIRFSLSFFGLLTSIEVISRDLVLHLLNKWQNQLAHRGRCECGHHVADVLGNRLSCEKLTDLQKERPSISLRHGEVTRTSSENALQLFSMMSYDCIV